MSSDSVIYNDVEIDEAKAKELLRWIIFTEKNNVKTRERNDSQMVAAIQKKIEEVVQCY